MKPTTQKARILVVEDEAKLAELVEMYLVRDGYAVESTATAEEALERMRRQPPNLVVLDIALPGMDGVELCRRLRAAGNAVPIVMLTARDSETDRVLGLEMGADDYVTKPFSPRELVARIKAILRRMEPAQSSGPMAAGQVELWPERREVRAGGELVELTAKEFDLVHYLLEHKGMVLSRAQLLSGVWGYDFFGGERNIDAHIRTIRKKLSSALPLKTVRGVGYKIEDS